MAFITVARTYGKSMQRDALINVEHITLIEGTPGGSFIYLLGCKPKNRIPVNHEPDDIQFMIKEAKV